VSLLGLVDGQVADMLTHTTNSGTGGDKSPSMATRLKHAVSGCLKHHSKVRWFIAGARNHLQANRPLGFCFEIPI